MLESSFKKRNKTFYSQKSTLLTNKSWWKPLLKWLWCNIPGELVMSVVSVWKSASLSSTSSCTLPQVLLLKTRYMLEFMHRCDGGPAEHLCYSLCLCVNPDSQKETGLEWLHNNRTIFLCCSDHKVQYFPVSCLHSHLFAFVSTLAASIFIPSWR